MDKDDFLISTLIVSIYTFFHTDKLKKKIHLLNHGYPLLDTHGSLDGFFVF